MTQTDRTPSKELLDSCPMSSTMEHETWLNSIGRERAALVREAEAAEIHAGRCYAAGRTEQGDRWEKIADDLYTRSREVAERIESEGEAREEYAERHGFSKPRSINAEFAEID